MKVWITKYALTSGVTIAEADVCEDVGDGKMIKIRGGKWNPYVHKPDWHRNEAAALERIGEMVKAKQRSLAKQQAALAKVADGLEAGRLPMAKGAKP